MPTKEVTNKQQNKSIKDAISQGHDKPKFMNFRRIIGSVFIFALV